MRQGDASVYYITINKNIKQIKVIIKINSAIKTTKKEAKCEDVTIQICNN